jgi:hypothetical protein
MGLFGKRYFLTTPEYSGGKAYVFWNTGMAAEMGRPLQQYDSAHP